eukprot:GDKI01029566.1.p1 GENE.GDKI01029566.1~~GDKI01029566.1.p1  ORF type:complete len:455 (-),score=87.23 GDKI01029566.1:240-1604(-)
MASSDSEADHRRMELEGSEASADSEEDRERIARQKRIQLKKEREQNERQKQVKEARKSARRRSDSVVSSSIGSSAGGGREKPQQREGLAGLVDSIRALFAPLQHPCCAMGRGPPRGADAPIRKKNVYADRLRQQLGLGGDTESEDSSGEEERGKRRQHVEPQALEKYVDWKKVLKVSPAALSVEKKEFACLQCCLKMHSGGRMDERTLEDSIYAAEAMPDRVNIDDALKREPFTVLECMRRMEARLLPEVLGEVFSMTAEEGAGGVVDGAYCVLSKVRTVLIHMKRRGEVYDLIVVDPSPSAGRGPAVLGFKRFERLQQYVETLFSLDPAVSKDRRQKFKCWILKNRIVYRGQARRFDVKVQEEEESEYEDEKQALRDPKYEAYLAYTQMHKTTNKRAGQQDEKMFAWSNDMGMRTTNKKEMAKAEKLFSRAEQEEEFDLAAGRGKQGNSRRAN